MFSNLKFLFDVRKLLSRWEDAVEKGWNPLISVRKALTTLLLFVAGAALMSLDEATLGAIVGESFPKEIAGVLTGVLVFGLRFAQNAWKVRAAAKAAGAALLALALLPGHAYAQAPAHGSSHAPGDFYAREAATNPAPGVRSAAVAAADDGPDGRIRVAGAAPGSGATVVQASDAPPSPAPSPTPKASATMEADTSGALVLDLSGWTLAVITRGEKREYVGGRATIDSPIAGKFRAFARGDVTGTQDFASVESFAQYQTFRSVEGYLGVRYVVHPAGLAVGALVGTSWSIEGDDGPLDPRMASALAVVRVPLPGEGYGYFGGGHRGPVGGAALVASVTYPMGPTRLLVDYDYPLTKAEDGTLKPWVLKTGVAVPIKRWSIR